MKTDNKFQEAQICSSWEICSEISWGVWGHVYRQKYNRIPLLWSGCINSSLMIWAYHLIVGKTKWIQKACKTFECNSILIQFCVYWSVLIIETDHPKKWYDFTKTIVTIITWRYVQYHLHFHKRTNILGTTIHANGHNYFLFP